jgi:hypothetical protein
MQDTWMVYCSFLPYALLILELATRLVVVLCLPHTMMRPFSNGDNSQFGISDRPTADIDAVACFFAKSW